MKPSHALSVWLEDQTLCVELPGTGEHSHTIRLEGENRWGYLFHILNHRKPSSLIGEPGDPTQYQIELDHNRKLIAEAHSKVRRVGKPKVELTIEQRAAIDQILREMGIA